MKPTTLTEEEMRKLLNDATAVINGMRAVLRDVVASIDWDQQDASRYYIGEDAAQEALGRLGFDWEQGISNEAVEKFLKEQK